MTPNHINALRRFASGKRINHTMTNILIDHGYLAFDTYGSIILTTKATKELQEPKL